MSASTSISGLSTNATHASITSPRLCVGMLVAIPTAMPVAPLSSRLGSLVGITVGSCRVSSKLLVISTVSLSRSSIMASPMRLSRASVYRMAAGLSPSTLPKLPCPSTSVYLMAHSCAMRTSAKYTELSPWGWNLPSTSPTIRAHFLYGLLCRLPISFMPKRMRLCTGLNPSLTSGSARATITLME